MTMRAYGDDEAREIFRLATTSDSPERSVPSETGGLVLDEFQRIAREAGIEPARAADAAAKLDVRAKSAMARGAFGLPIGVS